jgi:hypothetical protein
MEDITDLIRGTTKAAPVAPPAKLPAPSKGDAFRFENLQPSQVDFALKKFAEMGKDPRLLEQHLTSPEKFNAYPIEMRKRFFTLIPGDAPQSEFEAQSMPQEEVDPVIQMIRGGVSAPTPGAARIDTVVGPTTEKPAEVRKVGKVKDAAPAAEEPNPILDEILGAGETALTLGTGAISGAVGMPYGIYKGLTSGQFLEGKAADIAGKEAAAFMERNTYVPRTEAGQENVAAISKLMDASKLPPVIPEAVLLSSIGRAKPDAVPKPKVGALLQVAPQLARIRRGD